MQTVMDFWINYPYWAVFALVFVEQLGLPIPADPVLLATGALAAAGRARVAPAVASIVAACLLTDTVWYEAGRRRGSSILRFLCRISLEPDSCVRKTEDLFERHGVRTLLFAKFVPGLGAVAAPLAGVFGVRRWRFWLYSGLGAFFWAAAIVGLGFAFSAQLELLVTALTRLGVSVASALALLLVGYVARKYWQRRRFIRSLRIARITPDELKAKLDAGEELVVVDLRSSLDFEADPGTIPGALRMAPEDLEGSHPSIPRDRDVILYCT